MTSPASPSSQALGVLEERTVKNSTKKTIGESWKKREVRTLAFDPGYDVAGQVEALQGG